MLYDWRDTMLFKTILYFKCSILEESFYLSETFFLFLPAPHFTVISKINSDFTFLLKNYVLLKKKIRRQIYINILHWHKLNTSFLSYDGCYSNKAEPKNVAQINLSN